MPAPAGRVRGHGVGEVIMSVVRDILDLVRYLHDAQRDLQREREWHTQTKQKLVDLQAQYREAMGHLAALQVHFIACGDEPVLFPSHNWQCSLSYGRTPSSLTKQLEEAFTEEANGA